MKHYYLGKFGKIYGPYEVLPPNYRDYTYLCEKVDSNVSAWRLIDSDPPEWKEDRGEKTTSFLRGTDWVLMVDSNPVQVHVSGVSLSSAEIRVPSRYSVGVRQGARIQLSYVDGGKLKFRAATVKTTLLSRDGLVHAQCEWEAA
jgi:hypothetical protein